MLNIAIVVNPIATENHACMMANFMDHAYTEKTGSWVNVTTTEYTIFLSFTWISNNPLGYYGQPLMVNIFQCLSGSKKPCAPGRC